MSDDNEGFESVIDNPAAAAAIQALLADDPVEPDASPKIPDPADGYVRLPGGVVVDGTTITEVEVLELTGEDEEKLAKAKTSADQTKYYQTLLECGLPDQIGGKDTKDVLGEMLIGDREAILLGIRKATFGSEVELGQAECPECEEPFDAVIDVSDIEMRELKGDTTFEVKLRKGGKATVRLPVGSDWHAMFKDPGLTESHRNSILLSRCVITLPANGEEMPVSAFTSLVLNLGIVDRRAILSEIDKRSPGPRYDGLEIDHECGAKIPVPPLGLVPLFPGL